MESDARWLRTDPLTEGHKGLRTARRTLAEGLVDAYELKWAALAVVTSLQGFVVATHSGIEVLGWDVKALKRFQAWERGEVDAEMSRSDVWLPPFHVICEKVRERGWEPDDETWDLLLRLNEIRDTFIYFGSMGLSAEAAWLRSACRAGLAAVRFLVDNATPNVWPDEATERQVKYELSVAERLADEP